VTYASAATWMRTALFWIITKQVVVITTTHCIITQKSAVLLLHYI